ncbi:hypothetical protein NEOKW01_1555 [Nematocida sp. AWRm80]|nr:hypothetical protein NEOKW01_1555 [Nematocida sp. AWRm80]
MAEAKTVGEQTSNKKHRVIATNVPFNISDAQILNHFSGAVSIERHSKDGKLTGAVFIQCRNDSDVKHFIRTLDKSSLAGRTIGVSYLEDRDKYRAAQKTQRILQKYSKKTPETESNEVPVDLIDVSKVFSEDSTPKKNKSNETEQEEELDENARGRKRRQEFEAEAENKKRKMPEGEEDRTIFITNLPLNETEEDIAKRFSEFGEIEQCTCVLDKETGAPTGKAFVLFSHLDSCKAALKNKVILDNRVLVVLKYISPEVLQKREAEKKHKYDSFKKTQKEKTNAQLQEKEMKKQTARRSTCRVHISHITKTLTRKDINESLKKYFLTEYQKNLKLRGINIPTDGGKKNPGFGFITFYHPEDAQTFIDNQFKFNKSLGRQMTAEYAMESKEFLEKGIKKKPSKQERLAKRAQKASSKE